MRLAAIDIGTNSIHMIVVQVRPDLSFEVIDREKAMVRLGSGGLGTPDGNMGSSTNLFSGSTGTASSPQDIYFRTKWTWASDVPGNYSLTVNFTLSAP